MDLGLSGEVALVTGGAGRLGRSICALLAREGARVGAVDLDGRAQDVARELQARGGQPMRSTPMSRIGLPSNALWTRSLPRSARSTCW